MLMKQKILSILALLLMAATGAMAQTETLLTTITATGTDSYSETTPGVVTVTHDNYDFYENEWLWYNEGAITVEAKEGYTITRCEFRQGEKGPITISSAPFKVIFIEKSLLYNPFEKKFYCQGDRDFDMNGVSSIEVYGYAPFNVTANEGASGEYWSTFYNATQGFTADENTTVFQAALSGSSLTLTEVPNREIPATKAVILKSSSATITLTPASTTETLEGNELQGTATSITNPGNAYVLNKTETNGVGFYKLSSTGTIGANKAYLTYSGASLTRSFFGFDETTGIEMPTAEVIDADAVVYDLQGRRVAQPTKGLYIVNGKKVIIK